VSTRPTGEATGVQPWLDRIEEDAFVGATVGPIEESSQERIRRLARTIAAGGPKAIAAADETLRARLAMTRRATDESEAAAFILERAAATPAEEAEINAGFQAVRRGTLLTT